MSNKKRRLEATETKSVSAFAARNNLKAKSQSSSNNDISKSFVNEDQVYGSSELFDGTAVTASDEVARIFRGDIRQVIDETLQHAGSHQAPLSDASDYETDGDDLDARSSSANAQLLASSQTAPFSTIDPSHTILNDKDGSVRAKIAPGQRLVVLGNYDLLVKSGQVTILGALLSPSKKVQYMSVSALSSHSLPAIRCVSLDEDAQVLLRPSPLGPCALKDLSPLFDGLANDKKRAIEDQRLSQGHNHGKQSRFEIIYSAVSGSNRTLLQQLTSPPEWNEILSTTTTSQAANRNPRILMLCGPKSSGKSTFGKLWCNRFLTTNSRSNGLHYLDLDPGQPEYSAPGQLSLVHIFDVNLGPSYTHPANTQTKNCTIRSHSIMSTSPATYPELYMRCTSDLFHHYKELRKMSSNPPCPLIINTPGWILGTGLELLVNLIKEALPTDIIYMSQQGPLEVVQALQEASKTTAIITLPSQASEYSTRTAAQLRTMQTMSYLHLDRINEGTSLTWSTSPLTSIPPLEVRYSGEKAGIYGIMHLGDPPAPEMLLETINGMCMAVVVVDEQGALSRTDLDEDEISPAQDFSAAEDFVSIDEPATETPSPEWQDSLIERTPENLPFLSSTDSASLDPRHCQCIGMALIRGVDVKRERLQLLTPIPATALNILEDSGKRVILVGGKLDTPGWAYSEELNARAAFDIERQQSPNPIKNFNEVPWLQTLKGSGGRGIESRVWRVRRDLGKSGTG